MKGLSGECEPKLPRTKEVLEKLRIDIVEAYFVAAPFIFLIYKVWTLYSFWGALALTIILIVGYLVALEYLLWFKEWRVARKIKKEIEKKYHPVKGVKCLIKDPVFRDLLYRIKEAEELGWPYIPSVDRVPALERRVEISTEARSVDESVEEIEGEEELLEALEEYAMEEIQTPQESIGEHRGTLQTDSERPEASEGLVEASQEASVMGARVDEDLEEVDREIMSMLDNLIRSLGEEETHDLFWIFMESLGYRRYRISRLSKVSGIPRTTLRRYLEGRLPRGQRVVDLKDNILEAFSRCLEANPDALVRTLEKFAEKYADHREYISRVLGMIRGDSDTG